MYNLQRLQAEAQEWQRRRDMAKAEADAAINDADSAEGRARSACMALDRVTAELREAHDALLLLQV